MNQPADGDARRPSGRATRAQRYQEKLLPYQEKLEKHPWASFPPESVRRFNKGEGKHLAIVIALNLFVAFIPLIIIGYAFIEAFNPHRDIGNLIAGDLRLTGSTAQIVKATFANASSGKSAALSISVISLLITGLAISHRADRLRPGL